MIAAKVTEYIMSSFEGSTKMQPYNMEGSFAIFFEDRWICTVWNGVIYYLSPDESTPYGKLMIAEPNSLEKLLPKIKEALKVRYNIVVR